MGLENLHLITTPISKASTLTYIYDVLNTAFYLPIFGSLYFQHQTFKYPACQQSNLIKQNLIVSRWQTCIRLERLSPMSTLPSPSHVIPDGSLNVPGFLPGWAIILMRPPVCLSTLYTWLAPVMWNVLKRITKAVHKNFPRHGNLELIESA